jgi:MoxR-like ATPase
VTTWPVTGRIDELRQLNTALAEQRGAVITGPAGVGKTTLAMVCLQAAEDSWNVGRPHHRHPRVA